MFLAAYRQFGDKKYLKAAKDCGEAIWHRGLLLKGNGLCHGITGNTYPFLSLYRETQDVKWRTRAYRFARLSFDDQMRKRVR